MKYAFELSKSNSQIHTFFPFQNLISDLLWKGSYLNCSWYCLSLKVACRERFSYHVCQRDDESGRKTLSCTQKIIYACCALFEEFLNLLFVVSAIIILHWAMRIATVFWGRIYVRSLRQIAYLSCRIKLHGFLCSSDASD